jgi:hypothetical protein
MTGPAEELLNEPQPVAVSCKPRRVEALDVAVRDVAEGHRKTVVELLDEEFSRAVGIEKIEERVAKVGFVGR